MNMNNTSPKNIPIHFNYNTLHDVKNATYQKKINKYKLKFNISKKAPA